MASNGRYFETEISGIKIQIDPIDAYLRYLEYLDTHDVDPQDIDKFLQSGAQVGKTRGDYKYLRVLTNAIQHMFGVADFSRDKDKGLTISELLDLFGRFMSFAAVSKKNIEDSPSPSQSMEVPSSV